MDRQEIFVLVAVVTLINGIFAPLTFLLVGLAPAWMPGFLPFTPQMVFYGSSLLCSFFTLLASGIPAALSERFLKETVSPRMAMWIWLGAAVLISLPGIEAAFS